MKPFTNDADTTRFNKTEARRDKITIMKRVTAKIFTQLLDETSYHSSAQGIGVIK